MEPLTEKQRRVLEYIAQQVANFNYPPSVREIGKALGISSTATVHGYLDLLEDKGYIKRSPTKPRAIKLLVSAEGDPDLKCSFAPLIGRVAAGLPLLAAENREGYFPIPDHLAVGESCFVLIVSGDSMIDAGINDGDYVMVRQQVSAENGEIVAARIDDEATIKRFFKEDRGIRLQPANSAYPPILIDDVEILGKVVALFRKL